MIFYLNQNDPTFLEVIFELQTKSSDMRANLFIDMLCSDVAISQYRI